MRFDAQEYVLNWVANKQFPQIHTNIVNTAVSNLRGVRGVDVCCSHGLLATKMSTQHGYHMIGIDADKRAIALARENKIPVIIHEMKIQPSSENAFFELCKQHDAQFLIMRRCLPELFGDNLAFGQLFFQKAAEAGINELVLEGRVKTPKATNKLATIEAEIELVKDHYKLVQLNGNVAYLRNRT